MLVIGREDHHGEVGFLQLAFIAYPVGLTAHLYKKGVELCYEEVCLGRL